VCVCVYHISFIYIYILGVIGKGIIKQGLFADRWILNAVAAIIAQPLVAQELFASTGQEDRGRFNVRIFEGLNYIYILFFLIIDMFFYKIFYYFIVLIIFIPNLILTGIIIIILKVALGDRYSSMIVYHVVYMVLQ